MPDPQLSDLDAFSAVARRRSFRAAAVQRGVSASSLSDAVRRLEKELGVRLLNRTTRSVTPTEAGMRLLDRLTPALGAITEALDEVNNFRLTPMGTLRLNVPGAVASLVLAPVVSGFLKENPGISLEVTSEENFIDVLAAGFDAGIRYEEALEKDMVAVPIGPRSQRYALAASPAYLKAHGEPTHPTALLDHACVRHRFPSGAIGAWEFVKGTETVRIAPTGSFVTTSADLQRGAAVNGLGFIYTFEGWLASDLAGGTLRPVLEEWWLRFSGPQLYYPSRRHMAAPLRAFIDYLKGRAA